MQIEQESLEINYVQCSLPEITEMITDVFKPFQMVIEERKLTTQVIMQPTVPMWFFIERKIYCEILYNLI